MTLACPAAAFNRCYRRLVKTLTRPLSVALLVGCSTPPPHAAPGRDHRGTAELVQPASSTDAATVAPAASARPDPRSPAEAPDLPTDASSAESRSIAFAADAATNAPDRPSGELVLVEFETPYKLWHRPRPMGEVLAAERDEELARWNTGGTGNPSFISNQAGYHPATRVRVDARALPRLMKQAPLDRRTGRRARVLSEHSLVAETRKQGYWPFRLCFEDGLRSDRKIKGETIVRASVATTGSVSSSRLIRTRLTSKQTAECLVERVKKLELLPPPRRVDVELSIQLWPGDALLPSVGPPPGGEPEHPGSLDVSRVEPALEPLRAATRDCYSAALERDTKLWGRVELRFDLDSKGRLTRATENESRFPDPSVVGCLLDRARTLKFQPPKGGPLAFVWAARLGRLPAPAAPAPASPLE
jgi:hypothetical protein